jgi:hypothetical protein
VDRFKEETGTLIRPTQFEFVVEGFEKLRYLVSKIDFDFSWYDGLKMELVCYENEKFEAYDSLIKIDNITNTSKVRGRIIFYSESGERVRIMHVDIHGITIAGTFNWANVDEVMKWDVRLDVRKVKEETYEMLTDASGWSPKAKRKEIA